MTNTQKAPSQQISKYRILAEKYLIILLFIIAGFFEIFLYTQQSSTLFLCFFVRLLVNICAFLHYQKYPNYRLLPENIFYLLIVSYLFLGIGSYLGAISIIMLKLISSHNKDSISDFQHYIFDDTMGSDEMNLLMASVFEESMEDFQQSEDIMPLVDLLMGENYEAKSNLILQLKQFKHPQSVKLLKMALRDMNPEIRLMAANSLSSIESYYDDKIRDLELALNEEPTQKEKTIKDLVDTIDQASYMNFWNQDVQAMFTQKACKYYETLISIDPLNKEYYYSYARFSARNELTHSAQELFELGLKASPNDMRLKIWMLEIYYKTRNIPAFRKLLQEVDIDQIETPILQEVIAWWKV